MTPTVTVAICTHNRSAFIGKAVHSVLAQSLGGGQTFDVLVVDNASSDDTQAVAQQLVQADPRVRLVREKQLGLSYARNRAIDETAADYLAYLDDDAIADPGWLQNLMDAFLRVQPQPVAVGGPVRPIWGAPPPAWLGDGMRGCLTIIDFGERPHVIDLSREFIAGANMAFRRDALRAVGGFDASLGRVGTRLLSGEEILLLRQLDRRGGIAYYEPRASVQHYVPAERLDRRWFYRRYYWDGISLAVSETRLNRLGAGARLYGAARSTYSFLRSARYRGLLSREGWRRMRARLEIVRQVSKIYGYVAFR